MQSAPSMEDLQNVSMGRVGMGQLKGPKSHANRVEYLKKYSVIRVDGALLTLHFIKLLSYSRTELTCSVFLVFSHDSIIIYE